MKDEKGRVVKNEIITPNTNIVSIKLPQGTREFRAGNFLEIKLNSGNALLRRPYSIHWVDGDVIQIMNKVIGTGTSEMYHVLVNTTLDVLAPLGNSFGVDDDFEMGIILSGGVGVAPMAMLEIELIKRGKEFLHFVGARSKSEIVTTKLFEGNYRICTDDGSDEFKGTCLDAFKSALPISKKIKIFACGPSAMLHAIAAFANQQHIRCDVSLESMMGCGIGICYGCSISVKSKTDQPAYKLLCKEGSIISSTELAM